MSTPLPSSVTARKLSTRHVQFIAFGGAIGAGLFLGSGSGIALAGPALLFGYAACGAVIFVILRALGELALAEPIRGSFSSYAERYLGDTAGFVTGWSYWALWMLASGAEITATGILIKHWLPDFPQWIPAFSTLLLIYLVNSRNVRLFGEIEFWFALVKVVAIVFLIVGGAAALLMPAWFVAKGASITNLWSHGGLLPNGPGSLIPILPIALFAFGGVEVIGLTALESEDPERSLPRAISGVVIRILIFYIGSIAIIMSLAPWTEYSAAVSPFVVAMQKIGIPYAGDVINFVVITSAVSACSTGLYAAGRILSALAERSEASAPFAAMNKEGVPTRAINVSALCMLGVVFLNWLIPGYVLQAIMTGVALLMLWVWLAIVLSHISFRRRRARDGISGGTAYSLPFYPLSSGIVIATILSTAILLACNASTRPAFLVGLVWLVGLVIVRNVIARWPARRPDHGSAAAKP